VSQRHLVTAVIRDTRPNVPSVWVFTQNAEFGIIVVPPSLDLPWFCIVPWYDLQGAIDLHELVDVPASEWARRSVVRVRTEQEAWGACFLQARNYYYQASKIESGERADKSQH